MVSLYLIFYACLELQFPDVETNPGPRPPVPGASRILCSNVRGLSKNLSNVTVALSMICCCALRPWSRTGVICQSCWFLDLVILYCCAGIECRRPVGWLHMCEMDMGHCLLTAMAAVQAADACALFLFVGGFYYFL